MATEINSTEIPEGFEREGVIIPEGFDEEKVPTVEKPKQTTVDVLRIFPTLIDSGAAKKKRNELIKKDPDKFMKLFQGSQSAGFYRGLQDIGEGIKQLGMEVGVHIGMTDPKTHEEYTLEAMKEREQFSNTYGLFPGAKVTRFLGSSAPYAYLPIKSPKHLFGKMMMGATYGGGIGATQFVEPGQSRQKKAALGGIIGFGVPVVTTTLSATLQWANNVLREPFLKDSAEREIARFLKKHISENRKEIETAISRSVQKGENKSVAQIIAESNIGQNKNFGGLLIRLEKDLSRRSDGLKTLYKTQSNARKQIIDDIAGTEDDLAKAIQTRKSNSAANYEASFKIPINADRELVNLSKNKYFQIAARDADDLMKLKQIDPKTEFTRYLHYVKEGLDKQLHATDAMGKTALGRTELKAVGELQEKLVKWMGKKNKLYEVARSQHQLDSIPINKMEVGQEIKRAYLNALNQENPAMFMKSIRDIEKTIKKATGFKKPRKLDDIFTPDQINNIKILQRELYVEKQMSEMAGKSTGILKELTGDATIHLPPMLEKPITITNSIFKKLGKDKSSEYQKLLSDLMMNPDKFIKVWSNPSTNKRTQMAMDIIDRLTILTTTRAETSAE